MVENVHLLDYFSVLMIVFSLWRLGERGDDIPFARVKSNSGRKHEPRVTCILFYFFRNEENRRDADPEMTLRHLCHLDNIFDQVHSYKPVICLGAEIKYKNCTYAYLPVFIDYLEVMWLDMFMLDRSCYQVAVCSLRYILYRLFRR